MITDTRNQIITVFTTKEHSKWHAGESVNRFIKSTSKRISSFKPPLYGTNSEPLLSHRTFPEPTGYYGIDVCVPWASLKRRTSRAVRDGHILRTPPSTRRPGAHCRQTTAGWQCDSLPIARTNLFPANATDSPRPTRPERGLNL